MKALLLILIPMLVLAGLMTVIFWAATEPYGTTSVTAEAPAAPAPQPEILPARHVEPPALEPAPERPAPQPKPGAEPVPSQASAAPTGTSQPIRPDVVAQAEQIDDRVNINRSRRRHDRKRQLAVAKRALATSRPAEAIAACDRTLSFHPEDVEALSLKAEALIAMARLADAAVTYEHLVALRSDDVRVRYNYAVVLSRLERFPEARRQYESVLSRQPGHAKAMYNLAVIFQDEGKLSRAAELWAKVTDASPELASAWFKRGTVALRLDDYAGAAEAFTHADRLEPSQPDTLTNLGIGHYGQGQFAEAVAAYQRALKVAPKYLAAINGTAEVYLGYCEKDPGADERFECGLQWCEYSQGVKADQAALRALYERALKLRSRSVRAMNGLAEAMAATPPASILYERHRARAIELCRESLRLQPNQPRVSALLRRLQGPPPAT